jgi:hypothetical protein
MPKLPSGLELAISRDALFDHGGNWSSCPDGHFWYWAPAPEIGPPPYEPGAEIMQQAAHAPVPKDREEAKKYLHVLEMRPDGKYTWRGEWLFEFPKYTKVDERDLSAWNEWLARPETDRFLDATVEECRRLADVSRSAQGYVVAEPADPPDDNSRPGGWKRALFRPQPLFGPKPAKD